MRVIGGQAKGRLLKAPPGLQVRPTPAKVKEAMFAILGNQITDARILDLFAGTGSIGIEALSRGAKHVDFVEHHIASLKTLSANLERCGFMKQASIHRDNVSHFLMRAPRSIETFDIIFVDPPYHTGILSKILPLLSRGGIITQTSLLIIEHFHKSTLPNHIGHLNSIRAERYGDTVISFYSKMEGKHR